MSESGLSTPTASPLPNSTSNDKAMPYTVTVTLRRNETGEVRTIHYWTCPDDMAERWARDSWEGPMTPEEAVRNCEQFQWRENNNSCDCNRHTVFFQDDEELPEGVEEKIPCGNGKYDLLELKVNGKPVELY